MRIIFEVIDKTRRKIRLTDKQWKHIQKHPHMHDSLERVKETLNNPTTIRHDDFKENINYFYREYKEMETSERYLLISVIAKDADISPDAPLLSKISAIRNFSPKNFCLLL